jgi:hypothetical protein
MKQWKIGSVILAVAMVLSGWGIGLEQSLAGPVVIPTDPGPGGGGGGRSFFPDVSAQSGHRDTSGWASINGAGLIVDEMSGSAQIYPDGNPDDNIVARFSANINMSGSFAHGPNDFPTGNQGPSVNGQASTYEYSLVLDQNGEYVQGTPNFSIWYNGNTNYYINSNPENPDDGPELWTNIYSSFNLTGQNAQITNSWSDFSQNFWSGEGGPKPDWFTLSDWSGNMGISGVIVPEPVSLTLLGIGGVATYFGRRRIA